MLPFLSPGQLAHLVIACQSLNRASWDSFYRLLEPMRESHQIEPPGIGFVYFWSQCQKVIKSSRLRLVLSTPGAKAGKSSNRTSWHWFSRFLDPNPGGSSGRASWYVFVLSIIGARARKSSNRASWDWFCRPLGPRPESH